ncbi:MAG TPA: polysaccharide biosynthesis/export family protein [Sphingomicrobium sp.]|nr:polysaccharide biosynthesis/export family protein [Sphingomicrobium sp.]
MRMRHSRVLIAATVLLASLSGCQSVGPSRGAVVKASERATIPGLHIVDVNQDVARQLNLSAPESRDVFARELSGAHPVGTTVGIGDTVEVTIWEASPPALFGTANLDTGIGSIVEGSRPNTLPGFLVGPSGTISIPFAGQVPAAGHTTHEIEQEIVRRLQGRAHLPQAIVRVSHNVTATVTVLGDVKQPSQVPLTPHGERVLDVISAAGGTNNPLDRMAIQLTRGDVVRRMAAKDIITDPRNNVVLQSGDVVTALFQPYSFTVLGAAGKNEEIPFEATGISLSQALGRVGGLQNDRADPKGVFIFRWEDPAAPAGEVAPTDAGTDPRVPVIYRIDMKDPETYLASQKFEMRNGDILYVSSSPMTDFQRFVNILASSIVPVATVRNISR